MKFEDLGTISFEEAYSRQCRAVEKIASGEEEETVFLLEHPHTFTLGRRAEELNLLARCDFEGTPIEPVRINRGGDITYHGPGQLVGYPHLDLTRRRRDLHEYLRKLEECLILTARAEGVEAFRREGLTGVWTDSGKLASIGVGVRRWVTMHGFALNVNTDLRYFSLINPCGIPDCTMVSLESLTGKEISLAVVKRDFARAFRKVF